MRGLTARLCPFGALALALGCGSGTTGVRAPNQPPRIHLTAGPIDDSLHSYRVTFHWTAFDPDGEVAGFEYAADDSTAPDSLHPTRATSVSLVFPVREPPPLGLRLAADTLTAYHTFHVRAQDAEGLWSAFASATFNAYTIAPVSTILVPDPRYLPRVGTTFEVTWAGDDLDGLAPPRLFSSRLVWVPPESADVVDPGRLDRPGGGAPWTAFLERALARYEALVPGAYLFGVRALDDAGAVEPDLLIGRNVARLRVVTEPGLPTLTLAANGRAVALPTDDDDAKTFSMISGQYTTFEWSASAAAYGGRITEFAYGIDLESIDPRDPGWTPTAEHYLRLRIDHPHGVEDALHILYLRVTDSVGQDLVADVLLQVGPADFSRDILYVDDIGNDYQGSSTTPTDADHDRWVTDVLLAEARRRGLRLDQYEVQRKEGGRVPGAPDLAILRRYRLLVWSVRASGTALQASMQSPGQGEPASQAVARYVQLGGNLWTFGNSMLVNLAVPPTPTVFGFSPGELGYDILHVETERDGSQITAGGFERAFGNLLDRRRNGLAGASLTPEAAAEGWPALAAVREPYAGPLQGMPFCEGMMVAYEHPPRPGELDTLYTYVPNGRRLSPPFASRLDGAPCAFRYLGPRQGRVMVMSFPVDWWSEGACDSLGQSALRWFFEEEVP